MKQVQERAAARESELEAKLAEAESAAREARAEAAALKASNVDVETLRAQVRFSCLHSTPRVCMADVLYLK